MSTITKCPHCGSAHLQWHCQPENRGNAEDGRLKLNEIGVIFYLGCEECSETLEIIDGHQVAETLTAQQFQPEG